LYGILLISILSPEEYLILQKYSGKCFLEKDTQHRKLPGRHHEIYNNEHILSSVRLSGVANFIKPVISLMVWLF
jgi:hypothetical protein